MRSLPARDGPHLLVLALLWAGAVFADGTAPGGGAGHSSHDRAKIGLALSGGGARGAAHIGVLRVLEREGIAVDYIAGTSMGAVVGGLYASGMSVDELEQTITGFDWGQVFSDAPPRGDRTFRRKRDDDLSLAKPEAGVSGGELKLPTGLVQGVKFDAILARLTLPVAEITDFDQLPIPFRAVATDIGTGEMVVMGSGSLATALRASMSIPAAFAAVERDGRLLVDGGITNNIPIDVVREMGADVVIAVDISTPLLAPDKVGTVFAVTEQLVGFMTRSNSEQRLATLTDRDVLIVPDLGTVTTASFERVGEAIVAGEAAAGDRVDLLAGLPRGGREPGTPVVAEAPDDEVPVIDFIRIDNDSRLDDDVIASRLHVDVGQQLDVDALEQDLNRILGLGIFQNVYYRIVEADGRTGIIITAKEKAWGPNYVKLGLRLSGDLQGSNEFALGGIYTQLPINRLGGEWRTSIRIGQDPVILTELHQPLDTALRFFLGGGVRAGRREVNFVADGNTVATFQVQEAGLELYGGRELAGWGDMRVGLRRSTGESEVRIGDPTLPASSFDQGEGFVRLSLDRFDSLDFPTTGALGAVEGVFSQESLGADDDFEQLSVDISGARTWGANTVLLGGRFATTYEGDAPVQSRFNLGGFVNLSGFSENALSGQHAGLARALYYRRVGVMFFQAVYLGGSLEAGNVWEDADDIDAG